MKITIDTKEDSHSDIRKVIRLLKHLIGEDAVTNYEGYERDKPKHKNIFEDNSTPGIGGGLFGMFGDNQSKQEAKEEYPTLGQNDLWEDKKESTRFEDKDPEEPRIKFYGF